MNLQIHKRLSFKSLEQLNIDLEKTNVPCEKEGEKDVEWGERSLGCQVSK